LDTIIPSSLPEIDAVEVVSLRGLHPKSVGEYMAIAIEVPHARLSGTGAKQIAEMWRALVKGKQMRCHIPPFGLRFFAAEVLICEASICWKCNNIHGHAEGKKVFFEFDGSRTTARKLLIACAGALGQGITLGKD
jgi:hypothetical protein